MLTDTTNKDLVRRLINEIVNDGQLEVIDDIYTPQMARAARGWIAPFLASFSDVRTEIVDLIAEDDTLVALFRCSGTHTGEGQGHPPSGQRFDRIDEVHVFRIRDGRIGSAWGLEDTLARQQQLDLATRPGTSSER